MPLLWQHRTEARMPLLWRYRTEARMGMPLLWRHRTEARMPLLWWHRTEARMPRHSHSRRKSSRPRSPSHTTHTHVVQLRKVPINVRTEAAHPPVNAAGHLLSNVPTGPVHLACAGRCRTRRCALSNFKNHVFCERSPTRLVRSGRRRRRSVAPVRPRPTYSPLVRGESTQPARAVGSGSRKPVREQ